MKNNPFRNAAPRFTYVNIKYYRIYTPDGKPYKNGGQFLTPDMAKEYAEKGYRVEFNGVTN